VHITRAAPIDRGADDATPRSTTVPGSAPCMSQRRLRRRQRRFDDCCDVRRQVSDGRSRALDGSRIEARRVAVHSRVSRRAARARIRQLSLYVLPPTITRVNFAPLTNPSLTRLFALLCLIRSPHAACRDGPPAKPCCRLQSRADWLGHLRCRRAFVLQRIAPSSTQDSARFGSPRTPSEFSRHGARADEPTPPPFGEEPSCRRI
jgi:hypothetical protein